IVDAFEQTTDVFVHRGDIGQIAAEMIVHIAAVLLHEGEFFAERCGAFGFVEYERAKAVESRWSGIYGMMRDVAPDVDVERDVLVLLDEVDGTVEDMGIAAAAGVTPGG